MKPILSVTDHDILRELIKHTSTAQRTKEIKQLTRELDKAIVLTEDKLDAGVVRLNSIVDVVNIELGKKVSIKIVMPNAANLKENKVSIFALLPIALIGFKENDTVEWDMPSGKSHLKIIRVNNTEIEVTKSLDEV